MGKIIITIAVLLLPLMALAEAPQKETRVFAEKDGLSLKMDIYRAADAGQKQQPCLVFVFGGGFKEGSRDWEFYTAYYNYFALRGFAVVALDYRLGMKDAGTPGVFDTKPLRNAIQLAVDDLYSTTAYLLENADELNIDPSKIIISGSSAGAITVLQADYQLRNAHASAAVLPEGFEYAGVISFSGGVFSTKGVPSYQTEPAPTLFFHGSADKLVPYNKTRFFKLGMFGSASLAKKFKKKRYPYMFYSMRDVGHEVAEYPMTDFLAEIKMFIDDFIMEGKRLMIDIKYKDKDRKSDKSITPGSYYD